VSSVASSQRTREKLHLHVEKQVVQDIEDNGGLSVFDAGKAQGIASLLDNPERENLYGPRGGPLRDKIRKRIQVYRKWDLEKYLHHLKKLGVKRGGKNKTTGTSGAAAAPPLPDAIQEEKEAQVSDLEEEALTSPAHKTTNTRKASPAQKTTTRKASPAKKTAVLATQRSPLPRKQASRSVVSEASTMPTDAPGEDDVTEVTVQFVNGMEVIQVNPDKWNQGHGIKINKFSGHKWGGNKYSGYKIAVTGDVRDLELYSLDGYKEKKPNHEFVLSKPEIEAPFWKSKGGYDRQQKHEAVKDGHNIAATKYSKLPPDRRLEKFLICFPEGMELTDVQFLAAGTQTTDSTIQQKLILGKVKTDYQIAGDVIKTYTFVMEWYLCDNKTAEDFTGTDNKKPRTQQLLDDVGEHDSSSSDDDDDVDKDMEY
jgi:hypothetical protein